LLVLELLFSPVERFGLFHETEEKQSYPLPRLSQS
jgi:hypothetical protein